MTSPDFAQFISELGELLRINLDPSKGLFVHVKFNDGTTVKFEEIPQSNKLLISTSCGQLGEAGPHRESALKAALQSNHKPPPRFGIFCYLPKTDNLMLYDTFDLASVTGAGILDYLAEFNFNATTWREALAQGLIPSTPLEKAPKPPSQGGPEILGLRV